MHAPSPLQGSVEVREVRILFVGKGRAGKTSLFKALLSSKGLTAVIHEDDRTVGIDVKRGWRPGGKGSDLQVLHFRADKEQGCEAGEVEKQDS